MGRQGGRAEVTAYRNGETKLVSLAPNENCLEWYHILILLL